MASPSGLASVKQRERLVAALRPVPTAAVVAPQPSLLAELRPLPITPSAGWLHGFARLDVGGRVRDAQLFTALGWEPGRELAVELSGERALVRSEAGGGRLDPRGRLSLSETVRNALALGAGDGVLLSAGIEAGLLVVTPARCCDAVVSA